MSSLIPAIQLDMGYNLLGNDAVLPTNHWMQIFEHTGRCCSGPGQYYRISSADVNGLWASIYTKQLINAKHLIDLAETKQSPYNAAVGQILCAYTLGITTDLWGDIPYSDAIREHDIFRNPIYDSQEKVYEIIHLLLDKAIANLGKDASQNLIDIEGDVYYKGDPIAWQNAARAIKARHFLQLSGRNGNAAYSAALGFTDAFISNADNMVCPFSEENQNPLYQFMEQRAGTVMSSTLLSEMEANSDPRIPFYYAPDDTGGISGSDPGAENFQASRPGEYLAGQTAPTYLMTYSELKFIEAEAALQTGIPARAATAYNSGIAASVLQVTGDSHDTWVKTMERTAADITLNDIMMQKRHALVGQVQVYSDWRRTGIPELIPTALADLPAIPQRYPYPSDEINLNGENVPPIESILVPIWWAELD